MHHHLLHTVTDGNNVTVNRWQQCFSRIFLFSAFKVKISRNYDGSNTGNQKPKEMSTNAYHLD